MRQLPIVEQCVPVRCGVERILLGVPDPTNDDVAHLEPRLLLLLLVKSARSSWNPKRRRHAG